VAFGSPVLVLNNDRSSCFNWIYLIEQGFYGESYRRFSSYQDLGLGRQPQATVKRKLGL
jgi:hypothetical protein